MTDSEQVKAALAALADGETAAPTTDDVSLATDAASDTADPGGGDYRAVIERAVETTDDIEAAAAFVDSGGLERLRAAVETAEHEVSELADDGRQALVTFERFRIAAEGPREE